MKRFIALLTFSDQGRRTIQDSPKRADAFVEMAAAAGCKVRALYWTVGAYDGLLSIDAPDEETVTALLVRLASDGNVTTQTLQAFPREAIEAILAKVAGM